MKHLLFTSVVVTLCFLAADNSTLAKEPAWQYQIGCGSSDITGPVTGVQFWGFVREGQNGEGLHLRQRARAFVIADADAQQRLAIVVCDLGSITQELTREVIDRLKQEYGDAYSHANIILTATHTHAAPGGFWHAGAGTPFGSPLHTEYFDVIAEGIVDSIRQAHTTLQPGNVLIAQGEVPDAGANRSLVAYMNNPAEERAQYDSNTDTTMTLLRFETAAGPIACINWFAVHPTTMTYNNKLVSGDNKGYAEVQFERSHGVTYDKPGEFVAAFAQSNCGDVTGNLNLNNTGPGDDEFETTRIIGERQQMIAQDLFEQATEPLSGPVGTRQSFVDLGAVNIDAKYTQSGPQTTAPAAYGYSFAAGSTEDGGGHPLFREGMKETAVFLELTLDQQFPDARPSDELRKQHQPKAILIAPGEMKSRPGIGRPLSLTVARIGRLAIIAGPAEFTTMSGRRIRNTVKRAMADEVDTVVIAGYSNGYAGYVTTNEEYQTQQYEGGHTLFGPWTLAAYQQEYARIARGLSTETTVASATTEGLDLRSKVTATPLGTSADIAPSEEEAGVQITPPNESVSKGATVSATFWTSNPQNHYPHIDRFAVVEHQTDDGWISVATDADWSTRCVFEPKGNVEQPYRVTITWDVSANQASGTYRISHHGRFRSAEDPTDLVFAGVSDSFQVTD